MLKLITIAAVLMALTACQKQDGEQSGSVDTTLPEEKQITQPTADNTTVADLTSDALEGELDDSATETSDGMSAEGDPEGLDHIARRARMAEEGQGGDETSLPREARGNPQYWVTSDDYPPSAIRNAEQGTSGLMFDVTATGRVENCQVTASSGSSTLDEAACRLVTRRGRYSPALDEAGNPVAGGSKTMRYTWRLPDE
jgi:TonB family protein